MKVNKPIVGVQSMMFSDLRGFLTPCVNVTLSNSFWMSYADSRPYSDLHLTYSLFCCFKI